MAKKFRFLMAAALLMLFSTNAVAEDSSSDAKARTSADGSYAFKPSWGIGLQYGLTFTDMQNWNDYLLIPANDSLPIILT